MANLHLPSGSALPDYGWLLLLAVLVLLFAVLVAFLRGRPRRRMKRALRDAVFVSSEEFERDWILEDARSGEPQGYKYQRFPGCYVILMFDREVRNGEYTGYDDIYIGQSVNVTHRVHSHFTGKGNGDVYADLKFGRYAYVQLIPCEREDMNELERALIEEFDATESYNSTRGGGTDWAGRRRRHALFGRHQYH